MTGTPHELVAPASTTPVGDRSPASRLLARTGLTAAVITMVVFGVLHLVPPTSLISPVHKTLSEYGLTSLAWLFNFGVIVLAAGSLAIFAALTMLRRLPRIAWIFCTLWLAGLLTLVLFPKQNWAFAPSISGEVHRLSSLVAFLALPFALMIIARRGAAAGRRSARWTFWLGGSALLWPIPILIAIVVDSHGGTPWWQAIPLGLVERGLALTEVVALIALAVHAIEISRETPAEITPATELFQ